MNNGKIASEVLAVLEREPRINLHQYPIHVSYVNGVLTLEGETGNIAARKVALEVAASVPGVDGIVDRLRIVPAETMGDGAIRDHVCDGLMQEPAFFEYTVRALVKEAWETHREVVPGQSGIIDVEVSDGVVTLNGQVGSLSHKRLAGVLAWWVPGSTDVVNGLDVEPPEEDTDDEVTDAVRLVLEKDPFVNASQIRVSCRNFVVTLEGLVPKPLERGMAEDDAWFVFRVDKVINNIVVAELV